MKNQIAHFCFELCFGTLFKTVVEAKEAVTESRSKTLKSDLWSNSELVLHVFCCFYHCYLGLSQVCYCSFLPLRNQTYKYKKYCVFGFVRPYIYSQNNFQKMNFIESPVRGRNEIKSGGHVYFFL